MACVCLRNSSDSEPPKNTSVANKIIQIVRNPSVSCPFWNSLLICLCILVYHQVAQFDFVYYDDVSYTLGKQGKGSIFSLNFLWWAITSTDDGFWAPLTKISHQLDTQLFGNNAQWHHAVNLLLHIANSLLLWRLLVIISTDGLIPLLITGLFATHPLRAEVVSWIACRKDLLVNLFFILMLLNYLRWRNTDRKLYYHLTLICFFFACLSKPISMVFPVAVVIVDRLLLNHLPITKKYLLFMLPLFITSLFIAIITRYSQQEAIVPSSAVSLSDRLSHSIISSAFCTITTFIPVGLHVPYAFRYFPLLGYLGKPLFESASVWLISIISLCTFFCINLFLFRYDLRKAIQGFVLFYIPLVPVSGLIPFGHHLTADRFTYPSHVLFFVSLSTLNLLNEQSKRIPITLLLSLVLLVFSGLTNNQVSHWKNGETLFQNTLRYDPNNYVGLCNLGYYYVRNNRFPEAIPLLKKAIEINPHRPGPYNDLAYVMQCQGRYNESLEYYQQALELSNTDPEILSNIAYLLCLMGRYKEAEEFIDKALDLNPDLENAKRIKGLLLNKKDK